MRERPDRLADGVAGHAELLDQLGLGGDAGADRPLARGDLVRAAAAITCSDSAERRGWLSGMALLRTGLGRAFRSRPVPARLDNQSSHDSMMGGMASDETRH